MEFQDAFQQRQCQQTFLNFLIFDFEFCPHLLVVDQQKDRKYQKLPTSKYNSVLNISQYIRPQGVENRASRPLSRT